MSNEAESFRRHMLRLHRGSQGGSFASRKSSSPNVGHGANALVLRSRFGAWTVCWWIEVPPRVRCVLHKVAARGAWSAFHGFTEKLAINLRLPGRWVCLV
ncbi:unnamed protein product [Lasius platythorax]|uniref:Uncharacterized protein n=1 Tax=Lasius platythorax TaxID=488582 RepID=A0AAV2NYV9_9HYME